MAVEFKRKEFVSKKRKADETEPQTEERSSEISGDIFGLVHKSQQGLEKAKLQHSIFERFWLE